MKIKIRDLRLNGYKSMTFRIEIDDVDLNNKTNYSNIHYTRDKISIYFDKLHKSTNLSIKTAIFNSLMYSESFIKSIDKLIKTDLERQVYDAVLFRDKSYIQEYKSSDEIRGVLDAIIDRINLINSDKEIEVINSAYDMLIKYKYKFYMDFIRDCEDKYSLDYDKSFLEEIKGEFND